MSGAAAESVVSHARAAESAGDRAGGSKPQRQFQISLRALFLLVTYFNIGTWLAVLWNPGVIVPMVGLFLTWLSYRGYLWRLRTASARPKSFASAWILFLSSMALPALLVPGCNGPPTVQYGWEVSWSGVLMLAKGVEQTWTGTMPQAVGDLMYAFFVNLPNVLMLLSPVLYFRQQRSKGSELVTWWGCGAAATWFWAVVGAGQFRIGYYVWSLAISLEFFRRHVTRRALIATALFLPTMYLGLWLFD